MKLAAISVVCFLLFLQAAGVESRHHAHRHMWYNMFVFGDSFADNGNTDEHSGRMARAWRYPYGISYEEYNGSPHSKPTGRFSDYKVQTDFLANMLGVHEAPHPYNRGFFHYCHYGMSFATGGSGVFQVPQNVDTLHQQVKNFRRLLKSGTIPRTRLPYAVFLVAISGNDYLLKTSLMNNSNDTSSIEPFVEKVTDEIVKNVMRMKKLGAKKILVNNMHPLGCVPLLTRMNNHTSCDERGNSIASIHNKRLEEKLSHLGAESVLVLDLNKAFNGVIADTTDSPVAESFTSKLTPCCEPSDPNGLCGDRGDDSGDDDYPQKKKKDSDDDDDMFAYTLDTDNVESYFYWDEMNPTHAGWEAVMSQLEYPIKDFLGIRVE